MSPDDQYAEERVFVALGHNRGDFRWDAPANENLILRHLRWCRDQESRGWHLGAFLADGLTIFATTSRAELDAVLDTDPLVAAGVRHYAVSTCVLDAVRDPAG